MVNLTNLAQQTLLKNSLIQQGNRLSNITENMATAHIFVSGRVQGVFYRAGTRECALKHQLSGWVRNLSDGRVEAMFEGEKGNIEKVIEWCRSGPPAAAPSDLDVEWLKYSGSFTDFTLRY